MTSSSLASSCSASNNNGDSMTAANSDLASCNEDSRGEGGQMMTPAIIIAASSECNNNEANDSNNNIGAEINAATTPAAAQGETSALPDNQDQSAPPPSTITTSAIVRPPALPPRPANLVLPHARPLAHSLGHGLTDGPYTIMPQGSIHGGQDLRPVVPSSIWKSLRKKYVLLCGLCGGLCLALGILYLAIYFVLGRYTTSLHYFQTMPLYIPSIVLSVTGLLVLCFVRRANRNGYMIKLCGICCLASAVLCVVVTVTTTVVHMNRLQTLRECVYQGSIQTCTCFAGFFDPTMSHHDATMRFVFAGTPNCEVVHGVLYSCLRALFGLSVIGILVCIFSCMLVYQLLSHERKKKYWEQLERRCRHLYHQRRGLHLHNSASTTSAASMMLSSTTATSQCGYCSEDSRYYNMHPPDLCPGSLWNPMHVSEPMEAGVSFPWNNGNFYSPNPEDLPRISRDEADNGGGHSRLLTRSLSRSFRNWFPWLSNRISSMNSVVVDHQRPAAAVGVATTDVQMRSQLPSRQAVNPSWRHSNPDSHYGFRPQNSGGSSGYRGRGYHLPSSGTTPADLSHYAAINSDHLPRYLWGPPPPYSQPPSIENIRGETEARSYNSASSEVSSMAATTGYTTTTATTATTTTSARTTRSGILKTYDETVKSAMHLYERANVINSNSLPSRRIRKNAKAASLKSNVAKSVADLQRSLVEEEEAALFSEVRQKLNVLNGMYRYQHSKAAQELAEIRRALNSLQTSGPGGCGYKLQNLPLPPIPKVKELIYQPPSVVSSNSCSTENKYETIGKSLQPYKIEDKKPKRLPSTGSSYSSGSSSSDARDGFSPSSVSPMSIATACSSDHIKGQPQSSSSSHYAQISPLRGQGLPPAAAMGMVHQPTSTTGGGSVTNSPVKSYFQELLKQDAAKSLPNINAVGRNKQHQQPPLQLASPLHSSSSNMSPLLLQPQSLHQQLRRHQQQMILANESTSSRLASKSRSYSASSELLLASNNFNNNNPQIQQYKLNQNTRALVGSPIHQYQRYQPPPRAASSSSMLQTEVTPQQQQQVPHRLFYSNHPYQHLPGASLSLQTLSLSNKTASSSCVYLRPEQNIPEVFGNPGTVFKPIDEVDNDINDNDKSGGGAISRDDIVVTMRSVNV